MGRAVAPPNHGAAAPQHHVEAAGYQDRACCRWFARGGGGAGNFNQKIERGAGCLGLRWPPFINFMQQSNSSWRRRWKGCWGWCAAGEEHVGMTLSCRLGRRIYRCKKLRDGRTPGHRWPPFDRRTQQSTMSRRRRWEGHWRGERVGGCCLLVLSGVELKGNKNSKINYFVALDGSWTELQT
jgi:hypothetical protein